MPNVLVLYYSSYGHLEVMAQAQAEGARKIAGATVDVKRVPETVPLEICKASGFRLEQAAAAGRAGRARALRRHPLRHADPLRQHGGADA